MTLEEKLEYYESHGGRGCLVCRHNTECPGDISSDGGGEPLFPPCADYDAEWWVDEELLDEELRMIQEDEDGLQ